MIKSTIKEIFIILLLGIAILLLLGILFYDYIPINKNVPTKQSYVTPEEVKKEIDESISETEKIEVTYEVTDSDLDLYKQTGTYTEGKANPFALEENDTNTSNTDDEKDTNDKNNQNDKNDENNTNDKNENQDKVVDNNNQNNNTNTFWNDEGIK